ncbi:alanine--tRNA ligase-related protein [Pararhizobium sp. BT-229]|uniref:alanine--tRNA ligase-related protein n=1 Tax=Pararhizobium sp. BT-229 TaxID=2986923 RepID=UPI0021F71136|nr:alanine--tRNA ligase-related protein [Pararhizobium sp. BT-229]MCV9964470.1 alanine--tRNA ligase-related protein [Pararhizobium sp. BT-229]
MAIWPILPDAGNSTTFRTGTTQAKEVAYVLAGRLTHQYLEFCKTKGIEFETVNSVRPHDETTLFCSAGMQQFKPLFSDPSHMGTLANIQACLRLGDLDEIGDGTHSLYFDMLGLFSFRQMTVGETIDFWLEFLGQIGGWPDYVTIHPDRIDDWTPLYRGRVPVRPDLECRWSDGSISGYCTEFYKDGIEIGNIVNPLGTCIDVGFGLERLDLVVNGSPPVDALTTLRTTVKKIIESGYCPGNKEQGYVLRKLLRLLAVKGGTLDHPFFVDEVERQKRLLRRYDVLKPKHPDKTPEWWFDTHGIDVSELETTT